MSTRLVIGVDGGGTKTAAWLAAVDADGRVQILGRGTGGASNPRAVGFDVALAHVQEAIEEAYGAAGRTFDPAAGACLCLAGVARESERAEVRRWLERNPIAFHWRLAMDVEAIVAATKPPSLLEPQAMSIALIAGTGSIAWGRTPRGDEARSGGWGYLLGDEGSAYAIGMAALRRLCRSADGREPPTRLTEVLLHQLEISDVSQLIEWLYNGESHRAAIAQLCPHVFASLEIDQAAEQIARGAAQELALLVSSVAQRLGATGGDYDLALAGGVLQQQAMYREWLLEALDRTGCAPASYQLVTHPVLGAVHLAVRTLPSL